MQPQPSHSNAILGSICMGTAAVSAFLYMPLIAAALAAERGFTTQQVGEFSSLQLTAISVGCFANAFLSRRLSARLVAIVSVLALLAMDLLTPYLSGYDTFLASRAIAGFAGGWAVSLTTGLLARSDHAERDFGFFVTLQIVMKILVLWMLPGVIAQYGLKAIFLFMAGFDALALALAWKYVPSAPVNAQAKDRPTGQGAGFLLSGSVLLGILALFSAIGAVWTYVGFIGQAAGLSPEAVGKALSLATFGGLLGALVPVLAGNRLGRVFAITGSAGLMLASVVGLAAAHTFGAYLAAVWVFCFGWYVVYPYQLAVMAAVDRDGRPSVASAALTGLGLGIGPGVVSGMLTQGYTPVYVVSAIGLVLSNILCVLPALLHSASQKRQAISA